MLRITSLVGPAACGSSWAMASSFLLNALRRLVGRDGLTFFGDAVLNLYYLSQDIIQGHSLMPLRTLFALAAILMAVTSTPASAQGVCFFEDADFSGHQFCLNPGQSIPRLDPAWNDRISSADIPPGMRATVCENADFGGRCIQLDRSIRNFNDIQFNDAVSSLSVEPMRPREGRVIAPPAYNEPPRNPPPVVTAAPDDLRDQMFRLRGSCDGGDRRACVRLGIIIGENRGRTDQWRREDPDLFFWER